MKPFKGILALIGALALALTLSLPASSQLIAPQSAVYVVHPTSAPTTVRTLTAQGAGTLTSSDQNGFGVISVLCVFNTSAQSGTPSTTFTIQGKDAASGNYYNIVTSSAITASATPTPLAVGRDVTTTANLSAGFPVPATWRVSTTVGGTTPSVTATISCVKQN